MIDDTAIRRGVAVRIVAIVTIVAISGGLLKGTASNARETDELRTILRFKGFCGSTTGEKNEGLLFKAKFAPVRKLFPNEPPTYGTWGHTYETEAKQYPENTYVMGPGDNQVDLVSTLYRPKHSQTLPPYLWHVISVPSPDDDRAGFVVRHAEFTKKESGGGVWKETQYKRLLESETKEDDASALFYVRNDLPRSIRRNITTLWKETFATAMNDLVLRHFQNDRVYTHTFVYQDMPKTVEDINKDVGDRRNSSRTVLTRGTAFGFVLDHEGRCLASTTLKIDEKK